MNILGVDNMERQILLFEDFAKMYKIWKNKDAHRKEDDPAIKFMSNHPDCFFGDDGLVYSDDNVKITDDDLFDGKLPVKFGRVNGDFRCNGCKTLISLEGCPEFVMCSFNVSGTGITSLEGAPKKVDGYFYCNDCESLESLKGITKYIKLDLHCENCTKIKNFKGLPDYLYSLDADGCTSLISLEGCPRNIKKNFSINGCTSLISLEGAPDSIGDYFQCKGCGRDFKFADLPKNVHCNSRLYFGTKTPEDYLRK